MTEPSTEHRPTSSTLQQLMVGVSVALWLVAGAFVGVIACWVVALSDIFPIVDPDGGPARVPVGEHVYAGILVGGVILGLVACFSLRPWMVVRAGRQQRVPTLVAAWLVLATLLVMGFFIQLIAFVP